VLATSSRGLAKKEGKWLLLAAGKMKRGAGCCLGEEQTEGQGIATSSWERFTKRGARRLLPVGIVGQPPTNLVPRLVPKTLVSPKNIVTLFGVKCPFLTVSSVFNTAI
jgi:hypothetical protein